MPDVFSRKKRSWVMSRIRYKDTCVEVRLRKLLSESGVRYRVNYSKLPGKPDIAFPSRKIAIFIDGCFWHKCPKCYRQPQSNKLYWIKKIKYNVAKDKRVSNKLKKRGWFVLRFWEHKVKKQPQKCLRRVLAAVKND